MDQKALTLRTGVVVDAAMKVHTGLGPGLLENAYQMCLAHELRTRGLDIQVQVPLPVKYAGISLNVGYRIDLLVDDVVIVEVKAVSKILRVHEAQLLSYLKLSDRRIGLLLNFHVLRMKNGIIRIANNL